MPPSTCTRRQGPSCSTKRNHSVRNGSRKAWLKNIDENTSHFSDYVEQAEKEGGYPLAMGSQAEVPIPGRFEQRRNQGTPNSTDYGLDLSWSRASTTTSTRTSMMSKTTSMCTGIPTGSTSFMTTRWAPPKEAAQQLRKRFPNWDIVCFFHSFDDGKTGAFSWGQTGSKKTLVCPFYCTRDRKSWDSGRSSASSNSAGTSSNRSPKKHKQPKIRSPRPQVADDKMAPANKLPMRLQSDT